MTQILRHVTIIRAERLHNSTNGNPRYRLVLSDGSVHETKTDAACNYEVSNYQNSGKAFDAELTSRGHVAVIWKLGEKA